MGISSESSPELNNVFTEYSPDVSGPPPPAHPASPPVTGACSAASALFASETRRVCAHSANTARAGRRHARKVATRVRSQNSAKLAWKIVPEYRRSGYHVLIFIYHEKYP